jgi:hypothetical protein
MLETTSLEAPASIAMQSDGDFTLTWTDSSPQTGNDVYTSPLASLALPKQRRYVSIRLPEVNRSIPPSPLQTTEPMS